MRIRKQKKALLASMLIILCCTGLVAAQLLSNFIDGSWNVSSEYPLTASWDIAPPVQTYYLGVDYSYEIYLQNSDGAAIAGNVLMIINTGLEANFTATLNGTAFNESNPVPFSIDGLDTIHFEFIISFSGAGTTALSIYFDGDFV